jgi:hypothetical protein
MLPDTQLCERRNLLRLAPVQLPKKYHSNNERDIKFVLANTCFWTLSVLHLLRNIYLHFCEPIR